MIERVRVVRGKGIGWCPGIWAEACGYSLIAQRAEIFALQAITTSPRPNTALLCTPEQWEIASLNRGVRRR